MFDDEMKAQNLPFPGTETVFPYIYGDFTNWKPRRMYEIREYCNRIDPYKPNIFELCKQENIINTKATKIKDLRNDEIERYQREVKHHYEGYKNSWKDIIQNEMKYKRPHIVNANFKSMIENKDYPLFVYPCFMKCSK
jgi:hypothetical protein